MDHESGLKVSADPDLNRSVAERQAKHHVVTAALVVALGGLLYGYDTGVISGTLPQITQGYGVSEHGVTAELITALILAGAVVGALIMSWISNRLGRRWAIILVAGVFALGVIACALSPSPPVLMASRFFLGLAVGGSTQTIPTYISEIAPPRRRGSYVTFFNIAIGVGILTAALVNWLAAEVPWHWKVAVAVVPAMILMGGMFALPESPRWLVKEGEPLRARSVLERFRPSRRSADREVKDIQKIVRKEQRAAAEGQWSALFRDRWIRPAVIAGVVVAIFTQITGLEMMIYYTPTLLTNAGFDPKVSLFVNVGVGLVYVVMTVVGRFLVDRIGRRPLMLWTLPAAGICIAGFGISLWIGGDHPSLPIVLTFLLLFMLFQSGGIQVVGWLMGSELYPLKVRSAATSLHAMSLWGSNLLVTVTALSLVNLLSPGGAMLVYAALNFIAWVVIYYRVPETKGRSLEDIENSLRRKEFLPLVRKRLAREGKLHPDHDPENDDEGEASVGNGGAARGTSADDDGEATAAGASPSRRAGRES